MDRVELKIFPSSFEDWKIKRNHSAFIFVSISGIFYLYTLVSRTAYKKDLYTVPRLDGNFFRPISNTPHLINRAKKDIITNARKNENIDPRCDNPPRFDALLLSQTKSKNERSKRSTNGQGQRCLKRRLVPGCTGLDAWLCATRARVECIVTARATPGVFFERCCGCSHPTRQKSV